MSSDWPWYKVLLIWSAIGFGVLYFGGHAVIAQKALQDPANFHCSLWEAIWLQCSFSQVLLIFSAGGGIAVGLVILAWSRVTTRGFSWTLGFVILGVVLFAMFIWPTPYRYEWGPDKSFVVKIKRFSGDVTYELKTP
jgi:hypothetical protein